MKWSIIKGMNTLPGRPFSKAVMKQTAMMRREGLAQPMKEAVAPKGSVF
jgi:hypothetical protein